MANSVDPDEMVSDEQSHLDLHCLQRHLCWSAGLKKLMLIFHLLTGIAYLHYKC